MRLFSLQPTLCTISLHLCLLDLTRGDGDLVSSTTSASLSTTPGQSTGCAGGWSLGGDRCFHYDGVLRTYNESVALCEGLGAVIASIHSEEENDAVVALIPTLCSKTAYIGAESDGQGRWSWHDGTAWWLPEKHSDLPGTTETRVVVNCPSSGNDGLWHDSGTGSDLHGVVCVAAANTSVRPVEVNYVTVTFCWDAWTRGGDTCFSYSGENYNYTGAVAYCESVGSMIASIHSDAENAAALSVIPYNTPGRKKAYIGAEKNASFVWNWRDGTPWWQPEVTATWGGGESRLVISSDRLWHDWGDGGFFHGALCASPVQSQAVAISSPADCTLAPGRDPTVSVSYAAPRTLAVAAMVCITLLQVA